MTGTTRKTRKTSTATNNTNTSGANNMATNTNITLDDLLDILANKVVERLGAGIGQVDPVPAKATRKATKKAAPEPEDVEDEDEADDEAESEVTRDEREAELKKTDLRLLKKKALSADFDPGEVKTADKATLIEGLLDDEFGDDAEPDEDDEDVEEVEDESEDEDDAPDYDGMSLAELKKEAKAAGYTTADLKGLDDTEIVALLVGDGEDEDEDDVEEEVEEDSEDEASYTEDDLQAMGIRELKALAKEWEVDVPAGTKKADLIDLLME